MTITAARAKLTAPLVMLALLTAALLAVPQERAAAAPPPPEASFQRITLATALGAEPLSLTVLPDDRVAYVQRGGQLKLYKPSTGTVVLAGQLSVYAGQEDGLLGIAADPQFASNNWLYLYYSPSGATAKNRLSRFTLNGDTLNLSSEVVMLEIPTQRDECCHSSGSLRFGEDGNLYLSTGDNVNPFASDGYTPIDERAGRAAWDAQGTTANTNDLRGKILRIKPQPNGTYTIPTGNLFAPGTPSTRPEIYVMGLRNPFRFDVDPTTGWLYWGEYGPAANVANPARGPVGQEEFNLAKTAGNHGWPYCGGPNLAYVDYDFATGTSGSTFSCSSPTNASPNNTGRASLPSARGSLIWYSSVSSQYPDWTGDSTGEGPMGGPVYRYSASNPSTTKFPASMDGLWFIYEFERQWMKTVELDANGAVTRIDDFMPGQSLKQPIDMDFGANGSLYVLEYGTGTNGQGSRLSRINYTSGDNRAPVATAGASATSGAVPLAVTFDAGGSFDPDGDPLTYAWDFTNNGSTDSTAISPTFTYTAAGGYTARLTVTDDNGASSSITVAITAGNRAPTIVVSVPQSGQTFAYGDTVPFAINVTDPEDGAVACGDVTVQYFQGHDDHAHQVSTATAASGAYGCHGTILAGDDGGHGNSENTYGLLRFSYTDDGNGAAPPLTTVQELVLQERRKQAEFFSAQQGVQVVSRPEAEGGAKVGQINHNDWVAFTPFSLAGVGSVTYRVASAGAGGTLELRRDSPAGPLMQSVAVPPTGGWNTFIEVSANVSPPSGSFPIYLSFKNAQAGSQYLFDVDAVQFNRGFDGYSRMEAELYGNQSGVQVQRTVDGAGEQATVAFINNGDWISFEDTRLPNGAAQFQYRVASQSAGGNIEIRRGSISGPILGTCPVTGTGGWHTWVTRTCTVSGSIAEQDLYLRFTGGAGSLFNLNWFSFTS